MPTITQELEVICAVAASIDRERFGPKGASASRCLAAFVSLSRIAKPLRVMATEADQLPQFHEHMADVSLGLASILAHFERLGGRISFTDPPESTDDAAGSKQGS